MHFINHLVPFSVVLAICSLVSCAPVGKSPSGFLCNYAEMNAGFGMEDTVSSFVKQGVDLKKYDSAIIEPVTTIIATPGITPEVAEQLAAYLGESMREQVGAELKIVNVPSPTTLRVRTAFTDVIENQKAGSPKTKIHLAPQTTLSGLLGKPEIASFVSQVSFEGEILDSETGVRLAGLIDHRLGKKREASAATTWRAVKTAVNEGAKGLRKRLVAARAR
jgi:Protein of unknown function (DUF3313)